MVHTPLRVHVQHTSALSDRSQPYYTYMHQHTCSRLHMLSPRYAAIHPECACLCIFHGCFWARSPAPIPIPQYTLKLPNWQYSNAVSDAGDTLEAYLIWRRKRLQFSACALHLSPPRSFMEGQKGNELTGQIRASIPRNKDSSPHIIFWGKPPVSRLSGSKRAKHWNYRLGRGRNLFTFVSRCACMRLFFCPSQTNTFTHLQFAGDSFLWVQCQHEERGIWLHTHERCR